MPALFLMLRAFPLRPVGRLGWEAVPATHALLNRMPPWLDPAECMRADIRPWPATGEAERTLKRAGDLEK